MKRYVEGAIGVVLQRDRDRVLISRRRADDYYGGWWEFPGGKRRPEETHEQTLHRELAEELGIRVRVLRELAVVEHDYGDREVRLVFFLCEHVEGEPRPLQCDEPRWVSLDELTAYEFPAANAQVIRELIATPPAKSVTDS